MKNSSVSGKRVLHFRKIDSDEDIGYFVNGDKLIIVDIQLVILLLLSIQMRSFNVDL